jgi:hypothetical protein
MNDDETEVLHCSSMLLNMPKVIRRVRPTHRTMRHGLVGCSRPPRGPTHTEKLAPLGDGRLVLD